jgi:hypothetical protein
MNNNLQKGSEPLELIAPVPIEWEIFLVLENEWVCSPTGEVATCKTGGTSN